MGFDLSVWNRSRPYSNEEAGAFYRTLCSGDHSVVDPSPNIGDFLAELMARYPDINDYPLEKIDDCPWNCTFDRSEGHVILSIAWSRAEEVLPFIGELAQKHRLTVYDPQNDELYRYDQRAAS